MSWSPELRSKIGLDRASILRKLSPSDGQTILSELNLTPEELSEALSICKPGQSTQTTISITDPTRKVWLVAAWLLGASWRQLGILHGIAHSTIMQSARKAMTDKVAIYCSQNPIKHGKLPFERLEIMRKIYLEHKIEYAQLDPVEVAMRLDELAVLED